MWKRRRRQLSIRPTTGRTSQVHETIPALVAVLLLGLSAACASATATDTMPTNIDSARQLAQTVASKGGCDSNRFEDYDLSRVRDTWVFTCQKQEKMFAIVTYGSQEARSAGINRLDESPTQAYFAKYFYAVVVMRSGGQNKQLVESDKQSDKLALAPFRNK